MPNGPLLRTTMELVETSDQHDNREYALKYPDGHETYCFASLAIQIVYPDAVFDWRMGDSFSLPEDVPEGTQYATTVVSSPGERPRGIESLASELLGVGWPENRELFDADATRAVQRRFVNQLAPA